MATPLIFGYDANSGEWPLALSGSATNPASHSCHKQRGNIFRIGRSGEVLPRVSTEIGHGPAVRSRTTGLLRGGCVSLWNGSVGRFSGLAGATDRAAPPIGHQPRAL